MEQTGELHRGARGDLERGIARHRRYACNLQTRVGGEEECKAVVGVRARAVAARRVGVDPDPPGHGHRRATLDDGERRLDGLEVPHRHLRFGRHGDQTQGHAFCQRAAPVDQVARHGGAAGDVRNRGHHIDAAVQHQRQTKAAHLFFDAQLVDARSLRHRELRLGREIFEALDFSERDARKDRLAQLRLDSRGGRLHLGLCRGRLGFGLSTAEALEPNCFGAGTPPDCVP